MAAKVVVLGDVVDDDGVAAGADRVADRRLDLQLAARLQAESDLVAHGAGDPAVLGDPRDGGETHARRAAANLENGRHRIDAPDQRDIVLQWPGLLGTVVHRDVRLASGLEGLRGGQPK